MIDIEIWSASELGLMWRMWLYSLNYNLVFCMLCTLMKYHVCQVFCFPNWDELTVNSLMRWIHCYIIFSRDEILLSIGCKELVRCYQPYYCVCYPFVMGIVMGFELCVIWRGFHITLFKMSLITLLICVITFETCTISLKSVLRYIRKNLM